jgi:hypothetical protein
MHRLAQPPAKAKGQSELTIRFERSKLRSFRVEADIILNERFDEVMHIALVPLGKDGQFGKTTNLLCRLQDRTDNQYAESITNQKKE